MNLSLIGPPGSGKGTQLARLAQQYSLLPLNVGGLLRENLEKKSTLGVLARKYMRQGELVPDEVVDAMVESWVAAIDAQSGILFDGFPRTVYQARFLDELFSGLNRSLDAVIYLQVSPNTALRRLTGRLVCQRCHATYHPEFHPSEKAGVCDRCGEKLERRPDDNPEFAQLRLRAFQRASGPVLDYYHATNRLVVVEAESTAEVVFKNICQAIEPLARGASLAPSAVTTALMQLPKTAPTAPAPRPVAPGGGLVLVGGPGSGKGTQAEQLCGQLHVPHIATGDLFRDNLKLQTDLGKLAKTYMDRGELVPDDVTDAMVQDRLARPDTASGFVLDGFPRTLHQAEALTDMLAQLGRSLAGVIYINVSDDEIVHRLSGRLICRNCQAPYHTLFKPPAKPGVCDLCGGPLYQRDDDNPQTVRARLKTFHGQTGPLIDYYQKSGLVAEIAGEGNVAQVTARTLAAAQKLVA